MNYITNDNLEVADKEVFEIVEAELKRQTNHLEMIASENFTSPAVMQAMGSVFTNKYAEGYPYKRYYGGCEQADKVEQLAIDRACKYLAVNLQMFNLIVEVKQMVQYMQHYLKQVIKY